MTVSNAELRFLDRDHQQLLSMLREEQPLSKEEWVATWIAIRDWLEASLPAINQAFPLAARQGLTTRQKWRVFMAVAEKESFNG